MRRRLPETGSVALHHPAARQDLAVCAEMIRTGSRSFHMASLLLPTEIRSAACALYAFCRLSDDAVDGPGARQDAVERLRERLDLVYRGLPQACAVDRAFARLVAHYDLPRALPEALLEGLAWDGEGRRYRSLAQLNAYAARVAGAVGAMMTVIMGVRDEAILARACDLGVAMQLTNIARDVGEDARNGRIYLPLDWLEEAGVEPEALLACPQFDDRLAEPVARLLAAADGLYGRAESGIRGLPASCRPAIHAARLFYREIGHQVRRNGLDSVSARAVVQGRRKVALLIGALQSCALAPRAPPLGPLPETRFLVSAVVAPTLGDAPYEPARAIWTPPRRRGIDDSVGWVLELFAELDRRNRVQASTRMNRAFGPER
jgi:15-cis-phytoene synthase